jgi:hypothetical protein
MRKVVTIINVSGSGTYSALQWEMVRLSRMSNDEDTILISVEAGKFYADE